MKESIVSPNVAPFEGSSLPVDTERAHKPVVAGSPMSALVVADTTRAERQFESLYESPFAEALRASDPHYKVLCEAFEELRREPTHFTLFMKRLRMLVVEGRSFQEIASSQDPPVKPETLWAQISKTARALLSDVGMKGTTEDFKTVTAYLKRAPFEVCFQPWLGWYSQWKSDPLGVQPPPPVCGLVANELFERLGLGMSQYGKGVSGAARPGRAPEPVRREFSVHPFERDGFYGVEVRAIPEAFADCLEVMPRPRALALGYHERFAAADGGTEYLSRRVPALEPSPSEVRGEVKALSIVEGRIADNGDRLVGPTGALECLRRGIGPFDLNALTSIREISITGNAAYLDIFPFARGERHVANSLRFPRDTLGELGITHARLHMGVDDIAALRTEGRMSFSTFGYGGDAKGSGGLLEKGELGRVDILDRGGKLHVRFTPVAALVDERSRWYRGEVLNPRIEEILEGGSGWVPSIGWREINRDPRGRYPSFHMLGQDFFLSRPFAGDEVFVEGEVSPAADSVPGTFVLKGYSTPEKKEVLGTWTTALGGPREPRVWKKE